MTPVDLEGLKALAEKATPGPWRYRPHDLDDWGWVKSGKNIVATSRGDPGDHLSHDEHRAGGSDPYRENGEFIAAANPAAILSLLALLEAQASALKGAEWKDIATAPMDGTPFYVRHQSPYRFQPYKPLSEQYRAGKRGRWQTMNEYGFWDNCLEPVGDWKPHPDFPARSVLSTITNMDAEQ